MGPEDLERLTSARHAIVMAERAYNSTTIEVRQQVLARSHDLGERYEAEGLTEADRLEIGSALDARLQLMLSNLWAQEEHPGIEKAFSYPHKETKVVRAPGFVDMYLTFYHEDGPDASPLKPEGLIELTDTNDYWRLWRQNNIVPLRKSTLESHFAHAHLEDDINTLEGIYIALGIALPEEQ